MNICLMVTFHWKQEFVANIEISFHLKPKHNGYIFIHFGLVQSTLVLLVWLRLVFRFFYLHNFSLLNFLFLFHLRKNGIIALSYDFPSLFGSICNFIKCFLLMSFDSHVNLDLNHTFLFYSPLAIIIILVCLLVALW